MTSGKTNSESLIDRVNELEQYFKQYKLWANLIPATSFYSNLRKVLSQDEWDRVRKIVYKRQNYECKTCGTYFQEKYKDKRGKELHCHEYWTFDFNKRRQTLVELVSLCFMCHMSNHLGFCKVSLIPKGELTWNELAIHWSEVNQSTKAEFEKHSKLAFELWKIRSKIDWEILDKEGYPINEEYTKLKVF